MKLLQKKVYYERNLTLWLYYNLNLYFKWSNSLLCFTMKKENRRNFYQDNKKYKGKFPKEKKLRPNCFVSIPFTDKFLCSELLKIQNHMKEKYELFKECCIEKNRFHISLIILHVTKEQNDLVKEAFTEAMQKVKAMKSQKIQFNSLQTFHNDVLFIDLIKESQLFLMQMVQEFQKSFENKGIHIVYNEKKDDKIKKNDRKKNKEDPIEKKENKEEETNDHTDSEREENKQKEDIENQNEKEVNLHLTIMKNSMMKKKYTQKPPKFYKKLYEDFDVSNISMKQFSIDKIQLLDMSIDKSTSYYTILDEVMLNSK